IERLDDGVAVIAHGRASVYEARGDLQLIVDIVQPEGVGELQLRLEQLKLKLENEGLFEPSRKRSLPEFPKRVGVITSPTGAVWRDIQTVINRRYPLVELLLAPTLVQGSDAAPRIVEAFQAKVASREKQLLVVLIPSPKTMKRIGSTGRRSYKNLIDRVIELGIPVEDLSHGMLSRLSGRSPCEIATRPDVCRGHFNEEGNTWVADIVHEALAREGWLPAGTLR
ncbi:MAG: hypothetical protein IH965_12665, partial [Gemmatimonadetes bacterium]|nr:hypothetical protein [Gemmatimonadota bacterium]